MITLYLIRHGETVWNFSGQYQGVTDVALSDLGRRQAQCLVDYFADLPLDAIYSSDLECCGNGTTFGHIQRSYC